MKNKHILLIAALCAVLVLCALIGVLAFPEWAFSKKLDSLDCEVDDLPAYVSNHDNLHTGETVWDYGEAREQMSLPGKLSEILLVKNNRVWFVKSDSTSAGQMWYLCSAGLEASTYQLHFSGEFCKENGADPSYRKHRYSQTDYYESSGFYADGKIILTDHVRMVIYDMATETAAESSYDAALLSEAERRVEIDSEGLKVTDNGVTYRLDQDDLCAGSVAFAKLAEWGEASIMMKEKAGEYLFDGVQHDGENYYFFCSIRDYMGGIHAVVFRYDFEKKGISYCFNHYSGDWIESSMYIVPTL